MVLHWLKNKITGGASVSTENVCSVVIPDDVLLAMQKGRARLLVNFIDWASDQGNAEDILSEIKAQAKRDKWGKEELSKLDAYALYYSRRYQEAYAASCSFLNEDNFDADYFGVAAMALFNTNQFDQAYDLLRSIKSNEHKILGDSDYQIAATLICWSAGDRYLANKYIDLGMRTAINAGIMTFNALAMYFELGDIEGMAVAENLLDDNARAHSNFQYCLAFMRLAENNYCDGLKMAEARYEMPEAYRYMRKELFSKPRWQREDITGKTLLIHGEQGLGDMIQTARFFNDCLRCAKQVIVECPAESIALLESNFPRIHFVPLSFEKPLSDSFDVWTGTLSLPYIFDIRHDSVPGRSGYLSVPSDHRAYWRQSVEGWGRPGAVKVGVAWSGYPGHRADRRRSIPWDMFRYFMLQYPEVDFFAVQIKVPDDLPTNLYDCTEEMATLSDTVGLINEMDLIISVDTSVVHMAGAIGKETWMMLPYRYEWRWGLNGEWNPWYDSVKVVRQPAPGAWAPVLSNVFGKRFREFLSNRASAK